MLDVHGRKHTLNESFILAPPIFDCGGSETIVVRLKLSKGFFAMRVRLVLIQLLENEWRESARVRS